MVFLVNSKNAISQFKKSTFQHILRYFKTTGCYNFFWNLQALVFLREFWFEVMN